MEYGQTARKVSEGSQILVLLPQPFSLSLHEWMLLCFVLKTPFPSE